MDLYKEIIEPIVLKNQKIIWLMIYLGLFLSIFVKYAWVMSLILCMFIKDDDDESE